MARRRSRFIETRALREQRSRKDAPDPGGAIRLAGFAAALLVLIAVGAGFQGERFSTMAAGALGRLGPLAQPVLFGISPLEAAGLAGVLGVVVYVFWRGFRR